SCEALAITQWFICMCVFFFFQAEDGIRDFHVTGVQTCALPILSVQITDYMIAGITLSKLISTGNLSEVVANKMFTDIFNANKITAQEIAAGSITTEKIAAEGIVADVIQGGSFV